MGSRWYWHGSARDFVLVQKHIANDFVALSDTSVILFRISLDLW